MIDEFIARNRMVIDDSVRPKDGLDDYEWDIYLQYHSPTAKQVAQDFLQEMQIAQRKAHAKDRSCAAYSINRLCFRLRMLSRSDVVGAVLDDTRRDPYGASALLIMCRELGISCE